MSVNPNDPTVPKRIYAVTADGGRDIPWTRDVNGTMITGTGRIKVGDTTLGDGKQRVKQWAGTMFPGLAGVDILLDEPALKADGTYFRDHAVHKVLTDAGVRKDQEWFECTIDEVRAAIVAVRQGRPYDAKRILDFGLRPEQQDAVDETAGYFRQHGAESGALHYLWNAKMRFGKTFTTYKLAVEMEWSKVLVLTYKPAVQSAWKDDLASHVDFAAWKFIDRAIESDAADNIASGEGPFVWFASFQDLKGKTLDGRIKKHNETIHLVDWDAIVIDEYHFGAWRQTARDLYDPSEKALAEEEAPEDDIVEQDFGLKAKRYLYLSGTPFRAITNGEFTEDQVFNWTYIDEQKAKERWDDPDLESPYLDLPRMEMYTYRMGAAAEQWADDGEFNGFSLNEYFRSGRRDGGGKNDYDFADQDRVLEFLEMLRGKLSDQQKAHIISGQKPPFPYESARFTSGIRHSVWYMDDVAACYAMKHLLETHPYFKDYIIHVAAGTRAGQGAKAKKPVEDAIAKAERDGRAGSITLSCGKLMTGVTIKQWGAIFMLRSLKSPESYFQAAFRVQSPWAVTRAGEAKEVIKPTCYVFEFDPNRALSLLAEYGTKLANSEKDQPEKVLGELINYLPIFAFDGARMEELDATEVLNWASAGIGATALAQRWNSPLLVDVNDATLQKLLHSPDLLASLEQIEDFRNLTTDVSRVITANKKLKDTKREKAEKGEPLDDDDKRERDATQKLRTQIREKLQKFIARVPVFMYLTDHRESALIDVITSLDPALFERVTGLTIADFEMLAGIGVFNAQHMNFAIHQFRQFENASLRYAEENPTQALPGRVGVWDTVISTDLVQEAVPTGGEQ